MMADDAVHEFLLSRGCPDDVVEMGLEGLLLEWERAVAQVESGYPLGLDDYLNDLDGRQLLEESLEVAPDLECAAAHVRLAAADARMRREARFTEECLWGNRIADQEGWTAEHNWWYFAVPRTPGSTLREDLDAAG